MTDIVEKNSEIEEPKFFKVVNISLRLVHIGGVAMTPNVPTLLLDDKLGINRKDVETSEYLDFADNIEENKPVTKAEKAAAKAKSATGAGWGSAKA